MLAVNARYRHTSIGLRCLQANLLSLEAGSQIVEFTTQASVAQVVEEVRSRQPLVVGIGVYIWNVHYVEALVPEIRAVLPDVTVVLGGPEVSHELEGQPLEALADYVVQGEGERAFRELCELLLAGKRPGEKVIAGHTPPMADLELPYRLYWTRTSLIGSSMLRHPEAAPIAANFACPRSTKGSEMWTSLDFLERWIDSGKEGFVISSSLTEPSIFHFGLACRCCTFFWKNQNP